MRRPRAPHGEHAELVQGSAAERHEMGFKALRTPIAVAGAGVLLKDRAVAVVPDIEAFGTPPIHPTRFGRPRRRVGEMYPMLTRIVRIASPLHDLRAVEKRIVFNSGTSPVSDILEKVGGSARVLASGNEIPLLIRSRVASTRPKLHGHAVGGIEGGEISAFPRIIVVDECFLQILRRSFRRNAAGDDGDRACEYSGHEIRFH